ncbi:WD40 repeat domain-containing protein [bacterium]|nr:MAG: WD40 repeat domain-containing protein [bacterium]
MAIEPQVGILRGLDVHPLEPILLVYGDGGVCLLDAASLLPIWRNDELAVGCAKFAPDGRSALLAQDWTQFWLLDTSTFVLAPYGELREGISSIAFNESEGIVAIVTGSQEGAGLFFANYRGGTLGQTSLDDLDFDSDSLLVAFSPDGRFLACVDSVVRLYAFPSLEELAIFGSDVTKAALGMVDSSWSNPMFSADSSHLICQAPLGQIYFWHVASFELAARVEGNGTPGKHLSLSPNGKRLVSLDSDGRLAMTELSWDEEP